MLYQQAALIGLLIVMLGLFVWGRFRHDVVAMGGLMAAVIMGIVPAEGAFAGLGHTATVTVALMLILTHALTESGFTDRLSQWIEPMTDSVSKHVGSLAAITASMSTVMNNVGALALMLPIAMQSTQRKRRSPSLILMPMAAAALLGGLVTLVGTPPNIIVALMRQDATGASFALLDYAFVGLPLAIIGVAFVSFIGWRFLPIRRPGAPSSAGFYEIGDYVIEVGMAEGNKLIGKTMGEVGDAIADCDAVVLALLRGPRRIPNVPRRMLLMPGDTLVVEVAPDNLDQLLKRFAFAPVIEEDLNTTLLSSDDVRLSEVVVKPGSVLSGRSETRRRLAQQFNVNLLAVASQGQPTRDRLNRVIIKAGDVLLLQGEEQRLAEVSRLLGCLPLAARRLSGPASAGVWRAPAIFAAAILLAATGLLPFQIALGLAVVALVVTQTLPVRELYTAVEWPVIVLLACMIPIGEAMQTTGLTGQIGGLIALTAEGLGPVAALLLIFIITMAVTDVINNAATVVVMAPIAISVAQELSVSIDTFLMGVAIAASCAFLTPIGHQNNTLVMGPGGYNFGDYWRMGLPLQLLLVACAIPLLLVMWPL